MDFLTQLVVWLNVLANAFGKFILAPIAILPGWLSATLVSVASGALLLYVFKYTSNQRAIRKARNGINAELLALKLFKDSPRVALQAQARILLGAATLFVHALVPMLVMVVPASLLLGQLALWYQFRPLQVGEEAVITVKLNGNGKRQAAKSSDARFQPTDAVEIINGPFRVLSKREICWSIRACKNGYHNLVIQVDDQSIDKQLAIGSGFMRVSTERPEWSWLDAVLHPAEKPLRANSTIQSIDIDYPKRSSWTSGTDSWLIFWFLGSTVSALCFRRLLNVDV